MNKKLIEEVKRQQGPTGTTNGARLAVETVFSALRELSAREKITIRGFGTFETKTRAQRQGRNPRTGEAITIAEREELTFKAAR